MSDWLFDLGNSRFKFAPLRSDGRAGDVQAWAHGVQAMSADIAAALPSGGTAWVASVAAPALTADVIAHLRERFTHVRIARTLAECAGVRVAYAQPEKFGVDRFLALLGARALGSVLVAGVGTALTVDLMDADGLHRGGRISASPTTMREALHQRAAQLPASGGDYAEFANDTADALASGCDGAAVALIERSLQQASLDLAPVRLLLHGGGAPALLPLLPGAEHHPSLVLDGLAVWAAHHPTAAD
ncbi:type III pantothenate kinase [Stenotrophomonas panacihumi]|uniref:Type III pantothenate kinase n=1 Tax=Stenotrophomonas panacihumi TaxID=676599 RepID=A0A0R0A9C9_9GAMM|nr:type III pantothenate kinase [Stenotrophomonas panacihumi]KRG38414.1 type III pantothenate kinase [Stenotrophomonas panacihumi]PTN54313.1 type III pantothenate kinase [Stenotrophomonas panacihumi]